jgi:hypothetical protein
MELPFHLPSSASETNSVPDVKTTGRKRPTPVQNDDIYLRTSRSTSSEGRLAHHGSSLHLPLRIIASVWSENSYIPNVVPKAKKGIRRTRRVLNVGG